MIYLQLALILAFSLLFFFFAIAYALIGLKSFVTGAPPVPSPKKEIKAALRAVGLEKGDSFYDLGSGTGRVVLLAEKHGANSTGVEFSRLVSFISKINLGIRRSKSKIIRADFLNMDLSDADVVYIYGSIRLMERLEEKIKKESLHLKVVSYCFRFPNLKPIKKIKTPLKKSVFVYKI